MKFIILFLLVTSSYATIVGTPNPIQDANVTCIPTGSTDYYPVGDTRGDYVLTRREEIRECHVQREVLGECTKWKTETDRPTSIGSEAYHTYDTNDYSDTIGQMFASLSAYDQLEHIWSGYRGYCIQGTLQNFDWVSDPMFWGNMFLSYLMAGGQAGPVSESFNNTMESAGQMVQPDVLQANDAVINSQLTGLGSYGYGEISSISEYYINIGACLASGSVNLLTTAADMITSASGKPDDMCNPVDEICTEPTEDEAMSDIKTMDLQVFLDFVDTMSADNKNVYDFIEVIDDGSIDGIVEYRYKKSHEMEGMADQSSSEAEAAAAEMAMVQAAMGAVQAVGGAMSCMAGTGSPSANTGTQADAGRGLVQSGLNAGIGFATSLIPPPAGPLIGAAAKIIVALAMSFQSVDSCEDPDDASQQGSRHEKTYKALQFNLCQPIYDVCEDKGLFGGCILTGYHYCCYDQMLTKVLVLQMKAQLGRDYSNCTGITIRDLAYLRFKQCSDADMATGFDGSRQYGLDWNPEDAFQYKKRCMDMTEFKNYLQDIMGNELDPDVFEDYWQGLSNSDPV